MKAKTNNRLAGFVKKTEQLLCVTRAEYRLLFRDAGVLVIFLAVPLVYPFLYSLIYEPEVVRDLPVAVVDLSQSAESRALVRNINATPELMVTEACSGMAAAEALFQARKVRGIVYIPHEFGKNLSVSRQATVSVYADMEFFLYYKSIIVGTSMVAVEEGSKLQQKQLCAAGLTQTQAEIAVHPLEISGTAISNPSGGFASYGIPAMLMLIIQQTLVLAIGIVAGTAREKYGNNALFAAYPAQAGPVAILTGKAVAYLSVYAVLCIYMLGVIPVAFGYPHLAGNGALLALVVPYILASVFFGTAVSVFFRSRECAMLLFLFSSIPFLFLSGIIWPLSNFSPLWMAVRSIFPSSHAMFGYIKINSLGASVPETAGQIGSLWLLVFLFFGLSVVFYWIEWRRLQSSEPMKRLVAW